MADPLSGAEARDAIVRGVGFDVPRHPTYAAAAAFRADQLDQALADVERAQAALEVMRLSLTAERDRARRLAEHARAATDDEVRLLAEWF